MKYSRLKKNQKQKVDRAIALALSGLANGKMPTSFGKGYEAVRLPFSAQRRPSVVELTGEDGILRPYDRDRMINMHRDMLRNSPTCVSQDQQVRVNVVGNCGGKLYANFPTGYAEAADKVMTYFNRVWASHCEFTFGHNFNWVLKTILTAKSSNGNVILVFDDGILTDGAGTGKLRAFEGDEIANVSDVEFLKRFPKGYEQRQGFVYDEVGRLVGCFVSSSQRGQSMFVSDRGFITLKRDPMDVESASWIKLGDERRFNQGRAVSPLTAALTALVDLHEITASETQAAKINAQLVGQILQSAEADSAPPIGAFDDDTAADTSDLPETIEFSTKELSSIGARFDQMPEGMKIELLDTKRPNANMEQYIEFLSGLCGGTMGLARVYSTMKAQTSYTAFRGEQVMTFPSFEEMQKDLERDVCDVVARKAIRWGLDRGILNADLPENWEYMLSFEWAKMREVNETDAQNALAAKLRNGVTTLHRELGPGEYDAIIAEREREMADYKRLGLIYPGTESVSGSLVTNNEKQEEQ